MKVDFHLHCEEYSPCGVSKQEKMVKKAIEVGLDAIVFTNHHRFIPDKELALLNKQYKRIKIFNGIEITANNEDFIILGLKDKRLEREDWSYEKLYDFVKDQGGFIILAHPFRYKERINFDLAQYPPDAIEIDSINIMADNKKRIKRLITKYNLPSLSNSDAHDEKDLGKYYNSFNNKLATMKDLIAAVKSKNYSLSH